MTLWSTCHCSFLTTTANMVILSDLWSCFSPRPQVELQLPSEKEPSSCVFCNPSPDRFDIIAEDDRYLVFKDRSPAALHHLLAIPRQHIPNIKALQGSNGADLGECCL
jgi:hypothetical protein